jgi:3-oxoacyl-[acyl-carrier protein] reductase
MRLKDRVAIVTGAASGIGRAVVDLFAQEGARILAVDMAENALLAAHGENPTVALLAQDVSDHDAGERIVGAAIAKFGRLDIVMNNAGVAYNQLLEVMTDAAWDKTIAVNLTAQMRLSRSAIPYLKSSPAGRIINVASVMAEGTGPGLSAYCASKAGVAGLTRTLALELGRSAITANYIEPGAIATGMTTPLWEARPEVADIWAKKAALGRLGAPPDIARAALFLASDDAGFVTGHGLVVDGGLTLRV